MVLQNKTALVTGAGQGIGRSIACQLATAGADVVITHLATADHKLKAEAVKDDIQALGRRALAVPMDVTDKISIRRGLEEIFIQVNRIDILVNNAGVMQRGFGLDTTDEDFDRCHDVNVKGVWRLTQALVPHFRQRGEGSVVNIASGAGRKGSPDLPAYCASKAAVISLTQSLAAALGPYNIRVNSVCPGIIWTPMCEQFAALFTDACKAAEVRALEESWKTAIPLRRLQNVEDVGYAVIFLASSDAKNITGQALNVDGGLMMN